jgi:hypothetical protein
METTTMATEPLTEAAAPHPPREVVSVEVTDPYRDYVTSLDVRTYLVEDCERMPWMEGRSTLAIHSRDGWGLQCYPTAAEYRAMAAGFLQAAEVIEARTQGQPAGSEA